MIRNLTEEDWNKLREIHQKFYANEFTFDDFISNSMSNFVITDDKNGDIITGGSIRPIAEVIAITNQDKSARLRRDALHEILQIARFILQPTQMNQLHCFVQDQKWEIQLIKSGFARTKGNALYINL